jgi:hypothetical protein
MRRTFWKYCHLHDLYDFPTVFSYLLAYPPISSLTSLLKDLFSLFSLPLEPPGRIVPWPTATYYALYRFHPRSTIHWSLSWTQVYSLSGWSLQWNLDCQKCFTSSFQPPLLSRFLLYITRCLFAVFTQCPYLVLWQRWFCTQQYDAWSHALVLCGRRGMGLRTWNIYLTI